MKHKWDFIVSFSREFGRMPFTRRQRGGPAKEAALLPPKPKQGFAPSLGGSVCGVLGMITPCFGKRERAFTLVELLVSMIVTGFLMLTIVYISSIGRNSYRKVVDEATVFSDISYGFKLLQNRVHKAGNVYCESTTGAWASRKLVADHSAFGLYTTAATTDFVYFEDKDDETQREVLFSVTSPGTVNLDFFSDVSGDDCSGEALNAQLTGTKNGIPFDLSTIIQRRL